MTKWIPGVVAVAEVDEVEIELVAHGSDELEQVLFFLLTSIDVALLVNQPGDLRVRPVLLAQLLRPNSRGADEIRPPMIMRDRAFVLLPNME